jgi:hypothetical protein
MRGRGGRGETQIQRERKGEKREEYKPMVVLALALIAAPRATYSVSKRYHDFLSVG